MISLAVIAQKKGTVYISSGHPVFTALDKRDVVLKHTKFDGRYLSVTPFDENSVTFYNLVDYSTEPIKTVSVIVYSNRMILQSGDSLQVLTVKK